MNINSSTRTVWFVLATATIAAVIASCASPTTVEPPPPADADAGVPDDGTGGDVTQLEEITVTGSRSTGSDRMQSRSLEREYRKMQSGESGRAAPHAFFRTMPRQSGAAETVDFGRLGADEEIWVIAKPEFTTSTADDDAPGSGAMIAQLVHDDTTEAGGIREVPLPLQHTSVKARIDGYISSVSVTQQFANPFDTKIEAVYLFPLPEKAAVSEFLMVIGERRIRGILREKEQAVAIYEQARSQGYQASLLVQHRPNVFEQKVANIEPGKRIDVQIDYLHTLAYHDGWYSFVFPTVVGPRFNPPGSPDPLHAVARGEPARESGETVHYLRPAERSAHDIGFDIEVDAGVPIEELRSSHRIATERPSSQRAQVRLADQDMIPNRDFLLEFRVAGETMRTNVLTHFDRDSNEGWFTMMLYPPADVASLERGPLELVFVLDCSGSMRGVPLRQAKEAVSAALGMMNRGDTFQIIRFSDDASRFGDRPVSATPQNIADARRYLASLDGTGGTMMIEGIKAALDFPHDPERLRFVTFLTDGYIGNETEIIGVIHDRIGASRIFGFGVGSSVNRYLIERMAKSGRGAVAYLGPQDDGGEIMKNFFTRIGHPAMTDLEIDWGSMVVTDRYPAVLPDLFVGRPVVVTGRYAGTTGEIRVKGRAGGREQQIVVPIDSDAGDNPAIAKIWARLRIADLEDRQAWEQDPNDELGAAIRGTALRYQLMSDYTSFVAVDASRQTEGDYGVTVHQAVPVPDGVRYDTTVDDSGRTSQ